MNNEIKHENESDAGKSKKAKVGQSNPPDTTGASDKKPEHGGPKGLEPTRYGDWERKGRCIDF